MSLHWVPLPDPGPPKINKTVGLSDFDPYMSLPDKFLWKIYTLIIKYKITVTIN